MSSISRARDSGGRITAIETQNSAGLSSSSRLAEQTPPGMAGPEARAADTLGPAPAGIPGGAR